MNLAPIPFLLATAALAPFFLMMMAVTTAAAARWIRGADRNSAPDAGRHRFVVVIPAHDEESDIASTVAGCLGLRYDPGLFAVAVIADNCTDATAARARAAGAWVVERTDLERRSKGHALQFFFEHAAAGLPDAARDFDAAVIVDADTAADPGLLQACSAALSTGADWSQCYYTVSNPDASWRTRLMTYALSLINGVWTMGQDSLGLGATLRGNGMCFARRGLARHPWRSHGLTEDMEFSWMLRLAGERVRFLPRAAVRGEMVSRGGAAAASQRRRWEAGRAEARRSLTAPILRSGHVEAWRKGLYLIDLWFPPLSTLVLGLAAACLIHPLALAWPGLARASLFLAGPHAAMAATLVAYLVSPFLLMGLPARYLIALLWAPIYMAWKLIIATGARPDRWVRTAREQKPAAGPPVKPV